MRLHELNLSMNGTIKQLARWRQLCLLAALCATVQICLAQETLSSADLKVLTFEQRLGEFIDLNLEFQDESGRMQPLREHFQSGPVIMALGYYECPMLCNIVLNGIVESLQEITPKSDGAESTLVFLSVDPSEHPGLASAKKQTYLKRFGRPTAERKWHFLTGAERNITALAEQLGFSYSYDQERNEFAHPSGLIVLTPDGQISRYFLGVRYPSRELANALENASSDRVGTPAQQLLILCSQFMPLSGEYSALIMKSVRILAVATVLAIISLLLISNKTRHKRASNVLPETSNAQELT